MEWYKQLNINLRINAKDCFGLLCGIDFAIAGLVLSFKERINLMEKKLKIEGFKIYLTKE